jgi:glycosyltransferase involved in cell wall biosynthesis
MKRVLMIAYHFPPLTGSSGMQRTLRFARYLPEFGWSPIVLTANVRAYDQTSDDQMGDVPEDVEVIRAPAWDTSRHFAVAGRYPAFLALPDRWMSWAWGAKWVARRVLSRFSPDVIWSTYPIATAHQIGASMARRSGLPWIADFRDPMAQPGYPEDPRRWKAFDRIERRAASTASLCTFTTPGAARIYGERYPERAGSMRVIENGYDEETFADTAGATSGAINPGRLTLLHSGVVYPSERDPTQLLQALAQLKQRSAQLYERLVVRFRAPVHDDLLRQLAARFQVEEAIEILPPVGYREALEEMLRADGLLILQASNCNEQVPAKFYEYLRAGRPMLVLTDPAGDTAGVARSASITSIAGLDDVAAIVDLVEAFAGERFEGMCASPGVVGAASRRERTGELARLLEEVS